MTYEQTEALRAPLEAKHERLLRLALERQGEQIAQLLEDEDVPVGTFMDRAPVHDALRALWTETIPRFAARVASELAPKKNDDLWQQIAQAFIASVGAEMIAEIDATTLAVVREVVLEGVAEGWSMQRTAAALREAWPEVAAYRAERIARTEVIRASNHASLESARQTAAEYGLEVEKVWLSTPDGRVRASHSAANDQRRALDEAFDVGGYAAMYPGDAALPASESVNCRCAVAYEPVSALALRNREIKERYKVLLPQVGREIAFDRIAEDVNLSPHTVRDIVYKEAA